MSRVVFMGTPQFSVPILDALVEKFDVVGAVTQPDRRAGRGRNLTPPPVKVRALKHGLDIYQPGSLREPELIQPIVDWKPDVIVVAAYGQILRPFLLDLAPFGCINVHASLLPRWRGASPILHAILAGDDRTGISLMQMDAGIDTGPVFARRSLPILEDDNAAMLEQRLSMLGAVMIHDLLPGILEGCIKPREQDSGRVTYAPMLKKSDGRIDWGQPAADIARHIRAMTPWPGAFTYLDGLRLKIVEAVAAGIEGQLAPGEVAFDEDVRVGAGSGALTLKLIQLAGKKVTSAVDFARGRQGFTGAVLGEIAQGPEAAKP